MDDTHLAEDVVQDTLASALEHPPEVRDGVRAWMSRVLRNKVATRRLRERNRGAVERRSSRSADLASSAGGTDPARVESALESQRAVAAAVLDLPEPQRSSIYLRYYEGLELRAIARRQDAPLETIRSRIRRGLELLRTRLDGEFGSRENWCALLLPLSVNEIDPVPPGPGDTGGLIRRVRSAGPLPVIVAVSVLTGGLVLSLNHEGAALPRPTARAENGLVLAGHGETVAEEAEREAIGGDTPASSSLPAADPDPGGAEEDAEGGSDAGPSHRLAVFRFDGVVQQPGGGPVPGAEIYFMDRVATTDANGRFDFEHELWLISGGKKVATTWMPLIAVKQGLQPAVIERFTGTFDVTADRRHQLEMTLGGPELAIEGRVYDATGRPASGWRVALRDPTPALPGERPVDGWPGRRKLSVESIAAGRDVIVDTDDGGRFRIGGLLDREYGLIAWDPRTLLHSRVEGVRAGSRGIPMHVPDSALPRRISGRAVTASGVPIPNVRVRAVLLVTDDWKGVNGGRWAPGPGVRTDADGTFELEGHPTQPILLEVFEPGVIVGPPTRHELGANEDSEDLTLEAGLRCDVRVEARAGEFPSDLVALLDGQGERLWLRLPKTDPMYEQGSIWVALPLESRRSIAFSASDQARHLIFCNWGGEEVGRLPVSLGREQVNLVEW